MSYHHIESECSSIPFETCPYCKRGVARYRFATGDGVAIVTHHCAEHGDVIPRRHPVVRHESLDPARETKAPLTFCNILPEPPFPATPVGGFPAPFKSRSKQNRGTLQHTGPNIRQ